MRVELWKFMDTEPELIESAAPGLLTPLRVWRLKLKAWIHQQIGWRDRNGKHVKWDWPGSLDFAFWVRTGVSIRKQPDGNLCLTDFLLGRRGARGRKLENWITAYALASNTDSKLET